MVNEIAIIILFVAVAVVWLYRTRKPKDPDNPQNCSGMDRIN
jgi:cbb3-type cytochrome oxidase subunit 3